MKNQYLTLTILCISLSACSGQSILSGQSFPGSQLFEKKSRPKPLKVLAPVSNSVQARTIWQINTGSAPGDNQIHPFIDNQNVYIAGGTSASAWNKSTGKSVWKAAIGEIISGGVNGGENNQLFIGTTNGNAISLDAKTGKILWIERLGTEILSVSSGSNNRVIFRTIDGKLTGLSAQTGEIIWQKSQRTPALSSHGASVPVLVGNVVISGFDNGKLAAYSLQNGVRVWEIDIAEPQGSNELDRMVDIDGNLKILGKALFANSLNGNIVGINLEKGNVGWARVFSSSSGVDANLQGLYASDSDGNIWKLQPQTGQPMWKMDDLLRREPTTPTIVNPSLILVTDKQGNLHWINTQSGKFVARLQGDPKGYIVAPVIDNNSVYTLGKSGVLSKLQAQ